MVQDSVIGIASRYGLDGPGIKSRSERDFPPPSRRALGHTRSPLLWVTGLFLGGKGAGAWRWPLNPHLAPSLEKE
jgi:hypothetical protein